MAMDSICVMMPVKRELSLASTSNSSVVIQDIISNTTLTLALVESTQDHLIYARSSLKVQDALNRFVQREEEIDHYFNQ